MVGHEPHRPQHRAVSTDGNGDIDADGEARFVTPQLVAVEQLGILGRQTDSGDRVPQAHADRLGRQGSGLVPVVMDDEGERGHGPRLSVGPSPA